MDSGVIGIELVNASELTTSVILCSIGYASGAQVNHAVSIELLVVEKLQHKERSWFVCVASELIAL